MTLATDVNLYRMRVVGVVQLWSKLCKMCDFWYRLCYIDIRLYRQ